MNTLSERLLPLREVVELTGLSKRSLYRLGGKGQFPHPVKVGPRASRWRLSEIQAWLRTLK